MNQRIRLSANLMAYLVVFAVGSLIVGLINLFDPRVPILNKLLIFSVSAGVSCILFFISRLGKTLEYDEGNLYVRRKEKVEIISFSKIQAIERTGVSVKTTRTLRRWKISYLDKNQAVQKIYALIESDSEAFYEFIGRVKEVQPHARYPKWYHHFDTEL